MHRDRLSTVNGGERKERGGTGWFTLTHCQGRKQFRRYGQKCAKEYHEVSKLKDEEVSRLQSGQIQFQFVSLLLCLRQGLTR